MSSSENFKSLIVGRDLSEFKVEILTEVYRTDVDGRYSQTVGFFRNEDIAQAFAENQADSSYHQTRRVAVLTDGKIGFEVGKEISLIGDEQAALGIREKALQKLSVAERKLLGI